MDIPIHAAVQCTDGPDGHIDRIIIDPTTQKITHIVVREAGLLSEAVMVPVEEITESTPSTVHINLLRKQLEEMPFFVEKSYTTTAYETIPGSALGHGAQPMGGAMYWPYYPVNEMDYINVESNIPKGELVVHRSDVVEATDGHVGHIDEFLVDPRSDAITHLVLREGHLWGQKHVTIPVSQIARMAEGSVHLKLSKQQIEALPALHTRPV